MPNAGTIAIALLWGALFGWLASHTLANLLGVVFCLHGILMTRWKRLAHKAATGAISYSINLRLLLRVALYALLFVGLLYYGDIFIRKELRFHYQGTSIIIFAVSAALVALSRLRTLWKRSQILWRMSHEFDYAERRRRTQMLRS